MNLINFNNEQKLIRTEIRNFAAAELAPKADEIEKKGVFPTDIIKKLSDLGVLSLTVPEKYGGAGLDATSLCTTAEELSKVCASVGTILVVNNCMVAFPIMKYAEESQKRYYLDKISRGEIGAYICDPEIDLSEKKIEIKTSDDNCLISGNRDFVLNGEAANFYVTPVLLSNGKAFYLLEKGLAGITIRKTEVLGVRSAGIVSLNFKETELEDEFCFVVEDNGEKALIEIRDYSNIGFSAVLIGIAQAALSDSIKYSKEREQFRRSICNFPMIQEMIAEMKVKIEAGRFLVYEAAAKYDNGLDYSLASRIARFYCGEIAVFSGIKAVQIFGGYGYTKDYPVERYLRDAKTLQLLEVVPYELKLHIAEELLK